MRSAGSPQENALLPANYPRRMSHTNARPEESRVRHHFLVCTNRRPEGHPLPCCGLRGSESVYGAFLKEMADRGYPRGVKVTATSCLTPCQHGPNVVVYPQGIWYAGVTEADAAEIVAAHVDQERVVERLRLPEKERV